MKKIEPGQPSDDIRLDVTVSFMCGAPVVISPHASMPCGSAVVVSYKGRPPITIPCTVCGHEYRFVAEVYSL